jgi:hypothetical protein
MGMGDDSIIFPIATITVKGTSSTQAKKNAIAEVWDPRLDSASVRPIARIVKKEKMELMQIRLK